VKIITKNANKMKKCIICNEIICKYDMDFNSCGGLKIKDKEVCLDCAKEIAIVIIQRT
jgi:hypothetical protein